MRFMREIIFIFCLINISEESRILAIFTNFDEENKFNEALVEILIERGHHVDLISTFDMNFSKNNSVLFNFHEIVNYSNIHLMRKDDNELCYLMAHERMQKLFRDLKNSPKYDLILMEIFGAKCFMGLSEFLKVPLIIGITNNLQFQVDDESMEYSKSIIVPNLLEFSKTRNFFNRLKNYLVALYRSCEYSIYAEKQTEIMRKYLHPKLSEIREIEKNISLILSNSHSSLNSIQTFTSFIQIGGLHILEDKGKLSPELKSWLDKNTKGIVYFDLGGKMTIDDLPKKMIIAFLSSFAKIKPIRILMRVKDVDQLPLELPRNVKVSTHIPRIQVLAHKNVKAFITLGENLALQEAIYFGVPMIGISISIDHSQNLRNLVKNFVAFQINFEDLNERKISEALTIILKIQLFRIQTKRWSQIFKDRPLSAKQSAIYWIEYAIKNGPNSIKSNPNSLFCYQNEFLDIYAFLLFSLSLFAYLIVLLITKINEKLRQ